MLHHVSITVSDYNRSVEFYDKTLAKMGIKRLMDFDHALAGYGRDEHPFFWLNRQGDAHKCIGETSGMHICFQAETRDCIQDWYQECLKRGGVDNGPPGLRAEYDENYYAADIIDPDGWRIEAMTLSHV